VTDSFRFNFIIVKESRLFRFYPQLIKRSVCLGVLTMFRFLTCMLVCLLAATRGHADYYEPRASRGATVIKHELGEECIVPRHFSGGTYKDKDVQRESELCSFDFYIKAPAGTRKSVGICPKVSSTNPAVELYLFEAESNKETFENRECSKPDDDRNGKKQAKFKQSITCSYTPSILGYYHLSRILGNIGNVPTAVVRTMDKEQHLNFVRRAGEILSKLYPREEPIIEQAWKKTWPSLHADPEGRTLGVRPSMVFSRDYKYVYGALAQNPKKENKYSELAPKSYETRYEDFKAKQQYKNLLNPKPLAELYSAGSEQDRLEAAGQYVIQMQNIGDMIVIDYLMSQADRIGNIHFTYEYHFIRARKVESTDAEFVKVPGKPDALDPNQAAQMKTIGAVLVKQMMIRDNDCGVIKSNNAKKYQLLAGVRHINPDTYRRLLWLQRLVKSSENEVNSFFRDEALFSQKDWDGFKQLLNEVTNDLKARCLKGELHLDLDLEDVVMGRAPRDSRAFCESL
jgi:hypothetical protein